MNIKPFDNKIWLASPTMHGEEQKFVKEAFDTNWVSTVGENINEFEKSIGKYVGCEEAVALSSGTAAIHMALKCANINEGDIVFCSDLTFAATVNPVKYEKAIPVFIDSERDTWNMDPEALEYAAKKYPEAKAVVLVHLYGTPAKLDEIKLICKKHNLVLIEDAAESLGADYKGKQTGGHGDYNVISFNGNKIITTSGGGMLLTNNAEAARHVRKLSTQARESADWYQHEELGYNYRMSNIIAGIGRGQLLHLDEHIEQKKAIYFRYKEKFASVPIKMNPYLSDITNPNFWLSCILIDNDAMCVQKRSDNDVSYIKEVGKTCPTEILEKLKYHNVEGRPIWKPMHKQPIFKRDEFISISEHPIVDDLFDRGLCLPSDITMSQWEQDTIIEIIKSCFC